MQKRLNLCKTIVEIVKNSVGVVGRVKLFLLALFFLFHTTTFAYFPICCGCFLAFLVVAYPAISFLTFFGVRTFSYITYYGFSTLLFALNVPQHFIFNISRGTRLLTLHLLWLQHTPLCPKRTPLFHFSLFFGVRASSYITYCCFSTLLFTENVPQHFIFNISRGTLLNCLTYFPPPLCTKGYRVALASTRYPSTNSLTFYIHISIYLYSHFYISIFILTACLFASPLAYGYFSLQ